MTRRVTDCEEVLLFRRVGDAFCDLVNGIEERPLPDASLELLKVIHMLSHHALALPAVRPSSHEERLFCGLPSMNKRNQLGAYFGRLDTYWEIFHPYDRDRAQAISGSLTDDLVDIFDDIAPGLWAWERRNAAERRSIVRQWRFSYGWHWGEHATSAMRVLYWLVFRLDAVGEDDMLR